jgi:hypothetical protein
MKKELVDELLGNLKNMVNILQSVSDSETERQGNYDAEAGEIKTPVKRKRGRPKKAAKAVEDNKVSTSPKRKQQNFQTKERKSRTPKFTHNKFEEMMGLTIDKEEGYDKINDNVARTPRSRKQYNPELITCNSCNKTFNVNPMFKKENYICDRCVAKKIGR